MRPQYHGGGCCGRRHLYGFGPNDGFEAAFERIQAEHRYRRGGTNLVTEVVLTNGQLVAHRARVEAVGFRLVARWRNSNSGNMCNMFLHANDVTYVSAPLTAGGRVRVRQTGAEGVAQRRDGERIVVALDGGQTRTYKRASLVVLSTEEL